MGGSRTAWHSDERGLTWLGGLRAVTLVAAAALVGALVLPALAAHLVVGSHLAGSAFAIGTGDLSSWTALTAAQRLYITDFEGKADDSFTGGAKEDTTNPSVSTGSIPPNKSDLKEFFAYTEVAAGGTFLHLAWSRVQDPSGTTNMDFEFNQSGATWPTGIPKRTQDDLLITYDLAKGGTVPILGMRTWNGNDTSGSWGPYTPFDGTSAAGAINADTVEASGGFGPYSPRTFGEASINLTTSGIFDPTRCVAFGQAYVKSRSSDSFTSALKDFIRPVRTPELSNCGRIVVNKRGDTAEGALLAGATFTVTPGQTTNGAPAASSNMVEVADGVFCLDRLRLGVLYTVTETAAPAGYEAAPSQTFTVTEVGSCTGVNADTAANLTFVNTRPFYTVIVLVCTAGDDGVLTPSLVTGPSGGDGGLDSLTTSLGPPPEGGADEGPLPEGLCDLEGARYDGLTAGDATFTVDVGNPGGEE